MPLIGVKSRYRKLRTLHQEQCKFQTSDNAGSRRPPNPRLRRLSPGRDPR